MTQQERRSYPAGLPRQMNGSLKWLPPGLADTLTNHHHSRDFNFTRGEYLRARIRLVAAVFALMTPLWSIVDVFIAPPTLYLYILLARTAMMATFIVILLLARYARIGLGGMRHLLAMLLLTPALFYILVIALMGQNHTHLLGYSFIPLLLIAFISVFPLTLLEGLGLGIGLLALEIWSQFSRNLLFSAGGWQSLWLLSVLLIISLWANYSSISSLLRLYRQASQDPLTGLLNRGVLMINLDKLVKKHLQLQGNGHEKPPLTVIMMDLDRFKKINDTYGHSVGDEVLKHLANILRLTLRKTDIIARYGGEEFVIGLPGTPKGEGIKLAERIRSQCESAVLYDFQNSRVCFTASLGVAELRDDETIEELLDRVDNRLYLAKAKGRNCLVAV